MNFTEERVLEYSRALIKECLDICGESYKENEPQWNDAVRHIQNTIKERFQYE